MQPEGTEIVWVTGAEQLEGALDLRVRVFCDEQGVPREDEADPLDAEALHLVALGDGEHEVVGTLRVLITGETAKIGRVAVERERRREGIAVRMLALALERAAELGCTRAVLSAQTRATDVYRRVGFAVESGVYMEAGIEHVRMGRTLP
ncbi:MAG TPA: GNAT family N-acetyltransferase [Solirubrobacteraceae bacterium]|nr:GNAT family N-acetyltransferase [Solirubrobacteraceae bacterium]